MPYQILTVEDDRIEVKITGELRRRDQDALQAEAVRLIAQGKRPRVLILVEDFRGWEKGADWGDIGFLVEHGNDIASMAVVCEERWRDDALVYLGKGMRSTAIEHFPPSALEQAREWIGGA